MPANEQLTPEKHREQIQAYSAVRPRFVTYAEALRRVLERACQASFPEALVQSRAKTVSSFAEKAVRKFPKYRDPVNQFTDLCGARVIVQTAEQVRAIRTYIESNFEILESDDKGLLLAKDEFGYRDMHYIVRLLPERAPALGFTKEELAAIGDRRAEVQVRTWLQHAWADTLHDRMYKNKLKLSAGVARTGALLAALMEEGDRNLNVLADDLDGLIANYTAFAPKEDVEKEIGIQQLILDNELAEEKKPALAVNLAALLAATGDRRRVVELLSPYSGAAGAARCELLLQLGQSLCLVHRGEPSSAGYAQGREYLEESVRLCAAAETDFVPHLRKRQSLYARALSRLAWALSAIAGEEHEARTCFRRAHEQEPSNPYYLAAMLGFELRFGREAGLASVMATTIRQAIRTCWEHALAGIELPYAYFTAGRLSLLLDEGYDALGYYALGLRYCLAGVYCVPGGLLDEEVSWLHGIHLGSKAPPALQHVLQLLSLVRVSPGARPSRLGAPVLVAAGAAASLEKETAGRIRSLVSLALERFRGTVVSGGTTSGVPGCIGDIAGELAVRGAKQFHAAGYLPSRLPHGVSAHASYDSAVEAGDDFSPAQVLRYWSDILAGTRAEDVILLGIGGGPLTAVEYHIALGLGASVGIVEGTGGAADALLADPLWSGLANLYRLPLDAATLRAFVIPSDHDLDPAAREEMAKEFHARYVAASARRLPPALRAWGKLDSTFKKANLEQAHYSIEILKAAGFEVVEAAEPGGFAEFTSSEVEHMAELEHGRWNVERLRDGWRYGSRRDDARKLHDCLVPWSGLPEDIREYDRQAVRAFPEILAKAGLAVRRPSGKPACAGS